MSTNQQPAPTTTSHDTTGHDTTGAHHPASARRSPTDLLAASALALLGVLTLVSYLVLGGAPNPGLAAVALLPFLAALGLGTGRRWGAVAAVLAVPVVLGLRLEGISFDLLRPADLLPFAVAVLQVLAAGLGLSGAVVSLAARRRAGVPRATSATLVGGGVLAALVTVGAVVALAQPDDARMLTPEQQAAAPVVDMLNYEFEASQLQVDGEEVAAFRFVNDTDDDHTFTVDELGVDVLVPSGREGVVVVQAPAGSYVFHCSVGSHQEDGMEGRLVVATDAATPAATDAAGATDTDRRDATTADVFPDHTAGHDHG